MRGFEVFNKLTLKGSKLGRMILGLNLLGLMILIIGAMVLNEFSQGLIAAQQEALTAQARLTSEVIAEVATVGVPEAHLEAGNAAIVLARFIPEGQRARLFDERGSLLSDSFAVSESVQVSPLGPVTKKKNQTSETGRHTKESLRANAELKAEIAGALKGETVANVRRTPEGEKVVSVSIPLKRVKAVLGVLTLESDNVDMIISKQRWALLPFILVALGVTIMSSVVMHVLISRPIRRLSEAADQVRADQARAISLPQIAERADEIGTLARSLEAMTEALSRRMDEIERFAADVSHEIKNPLTSIRSALETLGFVKDEAAKVKLMAVINHDVRRLDRLITDISNASRLDAELSRDIPRKLNLYELISDIAGFYNDSASEGAAKLIVNYKNGDQPPIVLGREGPMGQVFRNLFDNARSFSPENGLITIDIGPTSASGMIRLTIDDQGPGIPEDALNRIFERFYTSRPRSQGFGKNSGLGLSIVRQIVEAHNGTIIAQNRSEGSGARFVIELPLL